MVWLDALGELKKKEKKKKGKNPVTLLKIQLGTFRLLTEHIKQLCYLLPRPEYFGPFVDPIRIHLSRRYSAALLWFLHL
jgi:hypothetical protein